MQEVWQEVSIIFLLLWTVKQVKNEMVSKMHNVTDDTFPKLFFKNPNREIIGPNATVWVPGIVKTW